MNKLPEDEEKHFHKFVFLNVIPKNLVYFILPIEKKSFVQAMHFLQNFVKLFKTLVKFISVKNLNCNMLLRKFSSTTSMCVTSQVVEF